jgi:hypothetical protein
MINPALVICLFCDILFSSKEIRRCKMKVLGCKDVGVNCKFVAKAETADEVLKKAAEHARNTMG